MYLQMNIKYWKVVNKAKYNTHSCRVPFTEFYELEIKCLLKYSILQGRNVLLVHADLMYYLIQSLSRSRMKFRNFTIRKYNLSNDKYNERNK